MFRIGLKFPYNGLSQIRRNGPSRLYLASRYYQQQQRCPEPAPPAKKKQGGGSTGFYYTIGTLTVLTAGTVAVAKYSPEFREWLNSKAPWTDPVLAIIFQEEKSWGEQINTVIEKIRDQILNLIYRKEGTAKREKKAKEVKEEDSCADIKELEDYKPPRSVFTTLLNQPNDTSEKPWAEIRVMPQPTEDAPDPPPTIVAGEKKSRDDEDLSNLPSTHPRNLVDLETKIAESAKTVITLYREAICALREHTQEIYKLVEDSIDKVDAKVWMALKVRATTKEKALRAAEEKADDALRNVNKLKEIVEDENFEAPEILKASATRNIGRVIDEITEVQKELEAEKRKSSITDKYWKRVEEARKHYMEELEILFPNIRLSDKEWNIASHDLDLFILHAFQNVLFYQKELSKLETLGNERIRIALEEAGEQADQKLIQADIEAELDKERRCLALDFQKKTLNLKKENEKEMRLQLKRQAEAHSDHLTDAVALREKELEREFLRQEDEKLETERLKFKYELAGMMGRLKGLEASLKARANADKNAHQSQLLWSACQSLYSSLKNSAPNVPWLEQLKPLEPEINAVRKAACDDDELVAVVLGGIPCEATLRGVLPEEALRERFLKVERVARNLALVPDHGASLPIFLLSYLQGFLLIRAVNPIPQAELSDEPVDVDHLDTYDILQRARYWMDRGDFSQTLRYMNLLKGASRKVSREWMNETRILLETQQAATALMAHAAASGLLYI